MPTNSYTNQSFRSKRPGSVFTTKSDLVFNALRDQIVAGELRPGEVIDQERIAAALDVSRMPLRQALLKLEANGLIELRPHRSAVVTPMEPSAVEEIYAMRVALESMLVEVATAHLADQDFAELESLNEQVGQLVESGDTAGFVAADRRLHLKLYAASGYTRAVAEVEQLRDSSDRYVGAYAALPTLASRSVAEHAKILQACRDRDGRLAAQLIRDHIQHGAEVLLESIAAGEVS